MPLTTPPLPFDPAARFPGLEPFARTATRLHPRSGEPTAMDSHLGGPLLWPVDEAWPACLGPHYLTRQWIELTEEHKRLMKAGRLLDAIPGLTGLRVDPDGREYAHGYVKVDEPAPSPMVPVAQLWARDIPDLRCPPGRDMLQVLWCPANHPGDRNTEERHYGHGPDLHMIWRTAAEIGDVLLDPPPPLTATVVDGYRVWPCVLQPERVVEYPSVDELPQDLRKKVERSDAKRPRGEPSYVEVAQAGGWKIGGYTHWNDDHEPHDCPRCAQPMPLLLSVDPAEPRFNLWEPVEERDVPRQDFLEPTGVCVGLRVFMCDHCADRPYEERLHYGTSYFEEDDR